MLVVICILHSLCSLGNTVVVLGLRRTRKQLHLKIANESRLIAGRGWMMFGGLLAAYSLVLRFDSCEWTSFRVPSLYHSYCGVFLKER